MTVLKVLNPGTRTSVTGVVATLFGASGFLGGYITARLASLGGQVVVPYRGHGDEVRHLKPLGDLGKIIPVPFDLKESETIAQAVVRSNVVVNCLGRDYETRNFSFDDVHVDGTRRLAEESKKAGIERFIHLSCAGADHDSPSAYFRSKAKGEDVVKEIYPEATILRPCRVFGHQDRFLNHMAFVTKAQGFFPLNNCGPNKVQPIYADDVALAVLAVLNDSNTFGKTYELGGPEIFTYEHLYDYIISETEISALGSDKVDILPPIVQKGFAFFWENLIWHPKVLTRDQVDQLQIDNIVSDDAWGLHDLGIRGTSMTGIAPEILLKFKTDKSNLI